MTRMRRNLVVYKLRKYLKKLYEGYPTHAFHGYEHTTQISTGINNLTEDGIIKLIGNNKAGQPCYRLTGDGLKLVETWENEKLVRTGIILTLIVLLVMGIQIIIDTL